MISLKGKKCSTTSVCIFQGSSLVVSGQVGLGVYTEYFYKGGVGTTMVFIVLSVAFHGTKVASEFLLKAWSIGGGGSAAEVGRYHQVGLFAGLSMGTLAMSFMANLIGMNVGARARRRLHDDLFRGLLNNLRLDCIQTGTIVSRYVLVRYCKKKTHAI